MITKRDLKIKFWKLIFIFEIQLKIQLLYLKIYKSIKEIEKKIN